MCGCLIWFIGMGLALSLASQDNWVMAIIVFIVTLLLAPTFGPREERL